MFNRKGSVSIAVMVVGTLFLFAAVLFILYTDSSRVSGDFNDVFWYGRVYANETSLENSLYFILLEHFLDNYQLVLKENSEKIGKENINFNEKFREKITDSKSYPRPAFLPGYIDDKSLVYGFNGLSAGVTIDNWKINDTRTDPDGRVLLKINYSSELSSNVSFDRLELPSFDDINRIYCECLRSSNSNFAKVCFENKFSRFDVSFGDIDLHNIDGQDKPTRILVKLNSKDKYYINKEMKKIQFNLTFDYFSDGESSTSLEFCPSVTN